MFRPTVPANIRIHQLDYQQLTDVPEETFERIRAGFAAQHQEKQPLVSVNIIAWNEESNILRNLSSLSAIRSKYPVEYVFVNNNSLDRTDEIIRRCGISPVFEIKQGYGFARQTALENSHGTYILTGDADTIYPPTWIDTMMKPILDKKSFSCSGTYSFLPPKGQWRLRYTFYEFFRDIIHSLRTINRPYLTVGGVNFCFPRHEAMKIGFIKSNSRSEDGTMALAMLKKGKLKRVKSIKAAAWTVTRSVERSGSFFEAIKSRIIKEFKRVSIYFYKHEQNRSH